MYWLDIKSSWNCRKAGETAFERTRLRSLGSKKAAAGTCGHGCWGVRTPAQSPVFHWGSQECPRSESGWAWDMWPPLGWRGWWEVDLLLQLFSLEAGTWISGCSTSTNVRVQAMPQKEIEAGKKYWELGKDAVWKTALLSDPISFASTSWQMTMLLDRSKDECPLGTAVWIFLFPHFLCISKWGSFSLNPIYFFPGGICLSLVPSFSYSISLSLSLSSWALRASSFTNYF